MTEIQPMTPGEAALCEALLKHDHILEADNVPRLPIMREHVVRHKNVGIIHVTAYSEEHGQQFYSETPFSKVLLEDLDNPKLFRVCLDIILAGVAEADAQGPGASVTFGRYHA